MQSFQVQLRGLAEAVGVAMALLSLQVVVQVGDSSAMPPRRS